ncbi:MAG TPA: TonB-dependent receptor [Steroidobacteraceae bacterium]|jgi:iron complex outermembrane receptor protein
MMNTSVGSRTARVAIRAGVGLVFAGAAVAQESGGQDVLQEVTVTAQFRKQSVQETPLSITAVSGDMLESRSQTNLSEVTSQAPNVTLKPQGAAFGPALGASIRGVGQFDFNPALEPGVGLYVDDVYYATLTGSILDLLDLDRVEVLRGPQGTLAGKNSIGGAVKLFSKAPSGEGGYLSATYGSRDRVDLRGSADFALNDKLFARISGVSKKQDGYVQRRDYGCDFPSSGVPPLVSASQGCVLGYDGNVDYSAVRGMLRFVATDNLEFTGAVDYTHDERNPAGEVLVQATPTVNPNVQPVQGVTALPGSAFVVPWGSYYNYATYYNPRNTFTVLTGASAGKTTPTDETRPNPDVDFSGWGASGHVDWKLTDRMSLVAVSAFRQYTSYFANDNDLSPLASSLGYGTLRFHSFSQELRLNGALFDGRRLEYTVGAFYMAQTSIYATTQDLRYSATGLTAFQGDDPVDADTKAAFAHASYRLTDPLTLNLGLRYTDEHKDYTFSRKTRTGATYVPLAAIDGLRSDYDGSKVDYRANVEYAWTDRIMTYAQVATGFKGGGISPRPFSAAQAVPFNPETLKSYELGEKADLFERRMRVNASVFFSDYTDMQLTLSACPQYGVGLPCAVVANAGDAHIKGAELETEIHPIDRLSIDGSISYLKFDYTSINPAAGGPTRPTGPQFGMVPAYTPTRKWSAGVQYEVPLGALGTLTPRVDASYQGDMYANGANAATNRIATYTLANARLTWRNPGGSWESSFEVTNLTDKYYYLTRFDQYTITGLSSGQPGRPREWALTVKRKFQ